MGLHIRPGDEEALSFYNRYFGQLIGATIIDFAMIQDDNDDAWAEVWPCFRVKLASGEIVQIEISQDEEGNGPGWIFGLEVPTTPSEKGFSN